MATVVVATIVFFSWRGRRLAENEAGTPPRRAYVDDATAFAAYAGSAACRDCHPSQHRRWAASNHGMAERLPQESLDRVAFDPPRSFRHGTQSSEVRSAGDRFEVATIGLSGRRETLHARRVIGHDPLRQFVVPAGRGREQVLEAAYDPHAGEWFNVYGREDRQPGEWGHWTGRGMTWNTMCASCHNTRLRKNYVAAADSFHTAMAEMTVGCEACHGPMKAHAEWRAAHSDSLAPDPTVARFSPDQWLSTCGSCHARRTELTGDFVPGEAFTDHYALTVPDLSDVYYPDGQVREENYEYAAFLGSRMHRAGVRCVDCHDPHGAEPILPGDLLCIRCHNGTRAGAPLIDPATHTFHGPGSTGSACVGCHMPVTVYMQRHPRHDHGFTVPDPLLTIENGTPNACNRCHTDRDARWSLTAVEKWYGAKMERASRARARTVAAARAGAPGWSKRAVAMLAGDSTAYWRAVACNLLGASLDEPAVVEALHAAAKDGNPMVRGAAARALEPVLTDVSSPAHGAVGALRDDDDRSVRIAAAWSLRNVVDAASEAGRDLARMLDHNADHVGGQTQRGAWFAARGEPMAALAAYRRALEWDARSAAIHHDYAVLLAQLGRHDEALGRMEEAVRLAPDEVEFRYPLALAYAEAGDLARAITELKRVTREHPSHARAWYNLGLALSQSGDDGGALAALREAERANPRDARAPYARATIHARRGETGEARAAAQRALDLAPDDEDARRQLAALETAGR